MDNVYKLLQQIRATGGVLSTDGVTIKVVAPNGAISAKQLEQIKKYKDMFIAMLQAESSNEAEVVDLGQKREALINLLRSVSAAGYTLEQINGDLIVSYCRCTKPPDEGNEMVRDILLQLRQSKVEMIQFLKEMAMDFIQLVRKQKGDIVLLPNGKLIASPICSASEREDLLFRLQFCQRQVYEEIGGKEPFEYAILAGS